VSVSTEVINSGRLLPSVDGSPGFAVGACAAMAAMSIAVDLTKQAQMAGAQAQQTE